MKRSRYISVMERAALEAGNSLLRDFNEVENLQVSRKGPGDFVSAADKRAEKIIVRELEKAGFGYPILSEEAGLIRGTNDDYTWVVDPLDGTMNFLHSIPHFSVSIALVKNYHTDNPEVVAGLVYAPVLNEIYWAEKGEGAYSNNRVLRVSERNKIQESLGTSSIWRNQDTNASNTRIMLELSKQGVFTRIMGSAALELAYVAAGKLEVFWHSHLKPWDVAAGMLLVKEARGMCTSINGGSDILETGSVLATNNHLYDSFKKIIDQEYEG